MKGILFISLITFVDSWDKVDPLNPLLPTSLIKTALFYKIGCQKCKHIV